MTRRIKKVLPIAAVMLCIILAVGMSCATSPLTESAEANGGQYTISDAGGAWKYIHYTGSQWNVEDNFLLAIQELGDEYEVVEIVPIQEYVGFGSRTYALFVKVR